MIEKPLPPPPPFDRTASEAPISIATTNPSETSSHTSRSSSSGGATFQRPRKRITWRNKTCFIALPIDSEFGKKTAKDSYLGFDDVAQRLKKWQDKGYDIRGFLLAPDHLGFLPPPSNSQSREAYPDSEDEGHQRISRLCRVSIPERRDWEAYVNQLKEEKLRALGVSFGDEEASQKSPAPSLMSCQASSHSSAMVISPALAPQSIHPMPYPSSLQVGPNHAVPLGKPSVSHFPRYSVATPYGEKPLSPSNQFPRPTLSPVHGAWSSPQYMGSQPGSRVASRNTNGHDLDSHVMAPPTLPSSNNTIDQVSAQGTANLFNQMHQQQALMLAEQQRQQQTLPSYPQKAADLVNSSDMQTSPIASGIRSNIASPRPRGHLKNRSEALQKEIEEAEPYQSTPAGDQNRQQGMVAGERNSFPVDAASSEDFEEVIPSKNKLNSSSMASDPSDFAMLVSDDRQMLSQREQTSISAASKLNVNAPEFRLEPTEFIDPEMFAFLGNQQPPNPEGSKAGQTPISTSQPEYMASRPSQACKFNVAAPEFTPGAGPRKPTAPSREFSFSATLPDFRPHAPASKPNNPHATSDSDPSKVELPANNDNKIFGDIKFPGAIRLGKNSKAIPIVKPGDGPEELEKSISENEGQEDESGHITQADGRQKRMKRDFDDGDQVPIFASPNRMPWVGNGDNDRAAYFNRGHSPDSEKGDAATLEAATDLLEEIIDDLSATEASDLMREDESVNGEGELFGPHTFHDIDDAANFNNTARPPIHSPEKAFSHLDPTPDDVTKATMGFLGKSPQFKSDLAQALEHQNPISQLTQRQIFGQRDSIDRVDHAEQDIMDGVRYVEPSYNELDAIMRHLNEDPDRGVERRPPPFKRQGRSMSPVRPSAPEHHHTSRSPVRNPTTELYHSSRTPQLMPSANLRSDAPSPSPNRFHGVTQYLPQTDSESANTSAIETIEHISRDIANNPLNSPSWPSKNPIPVHRLNSPGSTPPSDWNDAISSLDEDRFRSRTGFFDTRVNNLVGGVVQQRLGPLEHALSGIQKSLAAMSGRSASRRPRSSGTVEIAVSDADDEEETDDLSHARLKSPLTDPKNDQLKSAISDIVVAHHSFVPTAQITELMDAVKDLKATMPKNSPSTQSDAHDIKTIVEEALGKQLRGRSAPVTSSSVAAVAEKSQLQIAGLESMLKVAENRADDELKARRSTEDTLADNQRLLRSALQEAAEQRESAETTERTLEEYSQERQELLQRTALLEGSEEHLQKTVSDLSDKNAALEDTLAEYRLSSDQWRTEIDDARHDNKDLRRNINSLKAEIDEINDSRQTLRNKLNSLQEMMDHTSQENAADQLRWQGKEQEHNARLEMLGVRLEAEGRTRERLELEMERLEAQEKEAMRARIVTDQMQKDYVQCQNVIAELKFTCHGHRESAARLERDLHDAKESSIMEVNRTRKAMEVDVEAANNRYSATRADLEAVIAKLHGQIEVLTTEAAQARARHELMLQEASVSRIAALQEAAEERKAALQELDRFHQRILGEVQGQHERALKNVLEDKERSETYFGNRLSLADEKMAHYQDRIAHLDERLEIAKSAAHAAVQAAQNQKIAHGSTFGRTAQLTAKPLGVPEKISPQALRESILVLQEQLQQRESRIEQLESNLHSIDTTAPAKLKDAEVEITWLRELLGVRIDDLEDIIATLSQPAYDREAVKDATIRLKANLQMEQQEKERALAGGHNFPSIASISNLAASPRALPLAAAAAWGNWRKGREGFGNLSAAAEGSVQQTPSKSSPQSFFAGLMTPPSTNMRTTPPVAGSARPSSSLSSKSAREPPTTPKQGRSNRNDIRLHQEPVTPPLMRKASYDLDASESVSGFGDGGIEACKMAGEDEEPFGPRLGGIVGTV